MRLSQQSILFKATQLVNPIRINFCALIFVPGFPIGEQTIPISHSFRAGTKGIVRSVIGKAATKIITERKSFSAMHQ